MAICLNCPNPILQIKYWTSLVAQWLRIRLPMQGTWVWALVWEDPTCHGATKPMHHNCWACTLEPEPQLLNTRATTTEAHTPRAHALQQEKPLQWEALTLQRRVAPARRNQRKPVHSNKDPMQPKIKYKIINLKKIKYLLNILLWHWSLSFWGS